MSADRLDRDSITFAQAEGAQPLPTPLALKEVSRKLRVRLSKLFLEQLEETRGYDTMFGSQSWISGCWEPILYDKHVYLDDNFVSNWTNKYSHHYEKLNNLFQNGSYIQIFDFVQFVLRHPKCPYRLDEAVESILRQTLSAYRVIGKTIIPMASEAEGAAVTQAFADLSAGEFNGARKHLENSASFINQGKWADSVRESVHAVESAVRLVEGSKSVSDALKGLKNKTHINPNLARGIEALYNYTSDQSGIRHSLLDEGDAKVDEADALFMFGASASFVSYVIRKRG